MLATLVPESKRETDSQLVDVGRFILNAAVTPGDTDRPPILLINGIGARLELLQPFVDQLDPGRTVIRFDVPGIGHSPKPQKPYRFPMLARALARMLDQLGFTGEVDVLGISWGGALAQQFAISNRDRCRRLVLVSTTPGMLMLPAHPKVLLKMVTARRYRDPEFMVKSAGELYGGTMRSDPDLVADAIASFGDGRSSSAYYFQLACGLWWTSAPMLPTLTQRTLVISGDDDPLIRVTNARILGRLIRNSEVEIYQGGHLGMVTNDDEIAPVIEKFLDRY